MPSVIALTCPVCGAPLQPVDELCHFCGSYIVIKTDLPKLDRRALNQSIIHEHISDFRQRVRTDPYDEEAHYGLGIAYFSLGLADDAVDELSQAAKLMPENPHIQAQLAIALRDSFKAGNAAAERQMHARIQSALLLDPGHPEATMLKLDVLLDEGAHAEAIQQYQALPETARERAAPRLVAGFERLCEQRLEAEQWRGAQWCWEAIEPIDPPAAKRLALNFLNRHASLVPSRVKDTQSTLDVQTRSNRNAASSATGGDPSRLGGIGRTLLAAVAGLFLGFFILVVVGVIVSGGDGGTVQGGAAAVFMLTILLFILSPFIGAIGYRRMRKRTPSVQDTWTRIKSPRVRKSDVLRGMVDLPVIHSAVNTVMERLANREKVRELERKTRTQAHRR